MNNSFNIEEGQSIVSSDYTMVAAHDKDVEV